MKVLASARYGSSNLLAVIRSYKQGGCPHVDTISRAYHFIRGVASGHYDRPMGRGRTLSGGPRLEQLLRCQLSI